MSGALCVWVHYWGKIEWSFLAYNMLRVPKYWIVTLSACFVLWVAKKSLWIEEVEKSLWDKRVGVRTICIERRGSRIEDKVLHGLWVDNELLQSEQRIVGYMGQGQRRIKMIWGKVATIYSDQKVIFWVWVGAYIFDVCASISSACINKSWGLPPPVIWFLQQIHEIGASHGSSSKLIRYMQKEGVGASC